LQGEGRASFIIWAQSQQLDEPLAARAAGARFPLPIGGKRATNLPSHSLLSLAQGASQRQNGGTKLLFASLSFPLV
jgi:hypothetical protein